MGGEGGRVVIYQTYIQMINEKSSSDFLCLSL